MTWRIWDFSENTSLKEIGFIEYMGNTHAHYTSQVFLENFNVFYFMQ